MAPREGVPIIRDIVKRNIEKLDRPRVNRTIFAFLYIFAIS